METVLAGLQWDICLIYLDDVIIYGKNFDEMIGGREPVLEVPLPAFHFGLRFHA
jgi:hypothetical protein